jgi:hypothetical protein
MLQVSHGLNNPLRSFFVRRAEPVESSIYQKPITERIPWTMFLGPDLDSNGVWIRIGNGSRQAKIVPIKK